VSVVETEKAMINLVQLLCPARHLIMAAVYDSEQNTFDHTVKLMQLRVLDLKLNPWCGICGSTVLRFEEQKTKFQSITEAIPILKVCEAYNLASRQHLDAAGESYDAKLKQ